jgi:hypothetical protein
MAVEVRITDGVEAVPAGSLPLGEGDNLRQNQQQAEGQQSALGTEEGQIPQDQMILGKFKSQDELVKGYQDLEKDHGRLGTELGTLRKQSDLQGKQTEYLMNQLSALQQSGAGQQGGPATPDFDAQLAALTAKVQSGDVDVATALKETAILTAQRAAALADERVKSVIAEQSAAQVRSNFVKTNPDFMELQRAGQLEAIKAENPMHDDFSAYHEYKRREAIADIDAKVKAALEQGRQEGAKLAAGADAAGRVLGKAGGSPRPAPTTQLPKNEGEKISGMLSVLQQMRSGQG